MRSSSAWAEAGGASLKRGFSRFNSQSAASDERGVRVQHARVGETTLSYPNCTSLFICEEVLVDSERLVNPLHRHPESAS